MFIYPPVESSMRIYEHRRISAGQMASRKSSLNILPPTSRQPTMVSVKSLSLRMKSVHEEQQPSEIGIQWKPFLLSPTLRCSSPPSVLLCDGFQLCDDYSTEVPHVVGHFRWLFATMVLHLLLFPVDRSGSMQR